MEFRILGPLEVVRDSRELALGGPKQRTLLAILMLQANHAVSKDQLIDALWRENPPFTAPNILQSYVSQLRRILEPDVPRNATYRVLVTRANGYALNLDDHGFDLLEFQTAARTGRELLNSDPSDAADTLRRAMSLWRGPALADFVFEPFAEGHITRLEELRLVALEDLVRADLQLGRHEEVIGELEALVGSAQLRETCRELLMIALYRSGRQAEALNVYQAGRRTLVEELGIEPGSRLRNLEQSILAQDPSLDWEPATQLPPAHAGTTTETPARTVPETAAGEEVPPDAQYEARPPRLSRKRVSVLLADLDISSPDGPMDPETLFKIEKLCLARLKPIVDRYGGALQELAGGSFLVVFGVPQVHEDDADRAVRAAIAVRAELGSTADELPGDWHVAVGARIAVSSGTVVSSDRYEGVPVVTGEAVANAVRLLKLAEPREILLAEATMALTRGLVGEPVDRGPLRSFRVAEGEPLGGEPPPRFTSPMIGRSNELNSLRHAFQRSVDDNLCHLFTILGSAGVGKSRLLREFVAEIEDEATVLRGRCLSYGEGITYWPLAEIIRQGLRLEDSDSPALAQERVQTLIGSGDDARLVADRVASLLGLESQSGGSEEIYWAVRRLLSALAGRGSLVVVIDDLQWAEPTLLDLIENISDWSTDAPILLICSTRLEFLEARPNWAGGKVNATSLLLQPLSNVEAEELLDNLLGDTDELGVAKTKIMESAEGNPLFVEEIISMLVDDGLLRREATKWAAAGEPASAIHIPASVDALISARLDYLDPDEREVIEAASVVGNIFSRHAVAALCQQYTPGRVDQYLATLSRKELLRPVSQEPLVALEYRFRHLLVRDAANGGIPKGRRAGLHERYANWLEEMSEDRVTEFEEILAHHLEQAYRLRTAVDPSPEHTKDLALRAAQYLVSAGVKASARGDMPATLKLLNRAAALLPEDSPLYAELLPYLCIALVRIGDFPAADSTFRSALEFAEKTDNGSLKGRLLVERSFMWSQVDPKGKLGEAMQSINHAIDIFQRSKDDVGLARSWNLLARLHMVRGEATAMKDCLENALASARKGKSRQEEIEALSWLPAALVLGPTPVDLVEKACEDILQQSRQHPYVEAVILMSRGCTAAMRERYEEARDLLEQGGAVLSALGLNVRLLGWIYWKVLIELGQGDYQAAEHALRRTYEALRSIGEKSYLSNTAALLARVSTILGKHAEAVTLSKVSESIASPEATLTQVMWRTARARALAHQADLTYAGVLADEALELIERIDRPFERAAAWGDVAEVRRLQGRTREAHELVQKATRILEQKGDLAAAKRARAGLPYLVE